MEILWDSNNPLKPAEVLEKLGSNQAYTTVMTILTRMVEKNLLKRKLVGKAYHYSPVVSKVKYLDSNLKNIYGSLVGSYGRIAISNFVDVIRTNKEDVEILREYLNSHR